MRSPLYRKARLSVEALESRELLSCAVLPFTSAQIALMQSESAYAESLVPLPQATVTETGGKFTDPNSWKNGIMPTAGAMIEIAPGAVAIDDMTNTDAWKWIRIDGTLQMSQQVSTKLLVETIVNMPTGTFIVSEPNPSITSTIEFADLGPLDIINDPKQLGRGLIAVGEMNSDGTMGNMARTVIQGAPKFSWSTFGGVAAGSTSLTLADVTGLSVGDQFFLPGNVISGANSNWKPTSQDEYRTITSISGTTINWAAPLLYDHIPGVQGQEAFADVTRNVIFESQTATPLRAGAIMFMHTNQESISGAEFLGLGRTDKSKPNGALTQDTNGEWVVNEPNSFSLHLHRLYNYTADLADACTVIITDNVFIGSPSWNVDVHSSQAIVKDNVAIGAYGAAYVTQSGDEHALFDHDLAAHTTSTNSILQTEQNGGRGGTGTDYAFAGEGFWVEGNVMTSITNCYATETNMGYQIEGSGQKQATISPNGQFPWAVELNMLGLSDLVGLNNYVKFPTGTFLDNTTAWSGDGAVIWNSGGTHQSVVDTFTAWGITREGVGGQVEGNLLVKDAKLYGAPGALTNGTGAGTAIGITANNGYSSAPDTVNADVEGFFVGIGVSNVGTPGHPQTITGAYLDDTHGFDITGNYHRDSVLIQGDVRFGPHNLVEYFLEPILPTGSGTININNYFQPDLIYINTLQNPNSQLFRSAQGANVSPWNTSNFLPNDLAKLPSYLTSLTNAQAMATFGTTFLGQAASADAVANPSVSNGLVGSALPRPVVGINAQTSGNAIFANTGTARTFNFKDQFGNAVSVPIIFQAGWNLYSFVIGGVKTAFFAFGDDAQGPTYVPYNSNYTVSKSALPTTTAYTVSVSLYDDSVQGSRLGGYSHTFNLSTMPILTRSNGTQYIEVSWVVVDFAGNKTTVVIDINVI